MRARASFRVTALALASLAAGSISANDVVYRRGQENPAQGEITEITKTDITLKPAGTGREPIKIPANEITRVRWDKEPATLNLARNTEEAGRPGEALKGYEKALDDADASADNLRTDLAFLIARAQARQALADAGKLDEAVKQLEAFRTKNANHFRYFETLTWLGRLHVAKKEYDRAKTVFTEMGQAPWPDYRMAARIAEGRVLLSEGETAKALAAFDDVLSQQGDDPAVALQRADATLGKALCLQRDAKHDEAIRILDELVYGTAVDDRRLRGEAYLRRGDSLQALGRSKDALMAYLHVDLLFAQEPALHAEALFHLSRLWSEAGKPERAGDARTRLVNDYRNSEWAKKLGAGG